MQSEMSQKQKDKYCRTLPTWSVQNEFTEKEEKRLPKAGGGKDGELLFMDIDFLFGMTKKFYK